MCHTFESKILQPEIVASVRRKQITELQVSRHIWSQRGWVSECAACVPSSSCVFPSPLSNLMKDNFTSLLPQWVCQPGPFLLCLQLSLLLLDLFPMIVQSQIFHLSIPCCVVSLLKCFFASFLSPPDFYILTAPREEEMECPLLFIRLKQDTQSLLVSDSESSF